ncbi:MAG TPA: helix-turn-helix domain-containing protein [Rhizomicrobium sp.]|jgi:AcrR family transcriptional regulator|nr:helix-turn-helix domain-containing protein [Rhizomicrobium sp.]
MAKRSKKRSYDSSGRKVAAEATRHAILEAARRVFLKQGYAGATMPAIARDAGIALDTVYAVAGKKPALMRLLVESAISGQDEAVPAEQRDYVRAIRAEPDAAAKLRIYAMALGAIQPRLAPIFSVLQAAAAQEPDLKALWQEISRRRAANMGLLAQDLVATNQTRRDLSLSQIADIIWSMNAPEYFLLLVAQRGWTAEEFAHWLGDAWARLLLRDGGR